MKLATYNDGSRDGQLVVVSSDLRLAHYASHTANRLQQVLDDWNYLSPQLQDVSDALNAGKARHPFAFDPRQCMAPLPRAYQCVEGVGFVSHLELLYKSRGVEVPATLSSEPQWSQCSGDALHGPCEPIVCESEDVGIDFSAGLAAITSDLPMGCPGDRALDGVRLLMLCNLTRLHHLGGACAGTAFSPVAATPDELGDLWTRGRVHAPLQVAWNGRKVGLCDAGADMHFHFGRLLSQVCQTRRVCAGSIVTSGPVSNKGMERKGRPDWPNGYSSIAEKRAMEILQDGQAATEFMRFGDALRIDMKGRDGSNIFGTIDQEVATPACYAN